MLKTCWQHCDSSFCCCRFFIISSPCFFFQFCTLLHLCLVQQHCDCGAAPPAAGAGHQRQLQCHRAGGAHSPKREDCSQGIMGTCCGHWSVLQRSTQQLDRVPHHGGQSEKSSTLCPNRPGVVNLIQSVLAILSRRCLKPFGSCPLDGSMTLFTLT